MLAGVDDEQHVPVAHPLGQRLVSLREDWSAMPSAEVIVCLTIPASCSRARSANQTPS